MALNEVHKTNFETMKQACSDGNLALMECTLNATGEKVAVICMVSREDDGFISFAPVAMMFNDNPYEMLTPPTEGE